MARTLRLIFALVAALIGGLLISPPAHAAATNTVTFQATDPDGAPIAFAAWVYVGGNGSSSGAATVNLPDGDYTFAVSSAAMDGYYLWYDGTPSGSATQPAPTHLAGGQTLTISLQFPRLATLSGTVTNSDGDPLAGVDVLTNRGGTIKSAKTDAAGSYTFGYMRSGSVTIGTHSSGNWVGAPMVPLTIGASGTITKNFSLTKAGSIDGTLVFDRDGAPAPGITVVAYTKATIGYTNTTTTDADGHFHLGGLAGTDYVLKYSDPLAGAVRGSWWSGNAWDASAATSVAVASGATTSYDERLIYPDPADYNHTLSGTVSDTSGTPLAGIMVTAGDGSNQAQTTTDRNGRWALSTGDGSWKVRAESGSLLQSMEAKTPWYPQYYASAAVADTAAQATAIVVTGASVTDGLTVKLSRSARVKVPVSAVGSSDSVTPVWRPYTTAGAALPPAPTDAAGNPLFRPGSYKLLIGGEVGGTVRLPRWYSNATSVGSATILTLAEGSDLTGSPVSLDAGLAAKTAPTVTGRAMVGGTLLGSTGSWNLATATTFTTTWKRGSTVVGSAASYQPKLSDAGATLQYSVTATNAAFGRTFSTTRTTQITVAKLSSKTTLKAKATGGKKVRLTITVTSTVTPSGTVTVRRGSVVVGTAKLVKGKATITVKRQPKGKRSYQATFNGSAQIAPSASGSAKVKVR